MGFSKANVQLLVSSIVVKVAIKVNWLNYELCLVFIHLVRAIGIMP